MDKQTKFAPTTQAKAIRDSIKRAQETAAFQRDEAERIARSLRKLSNELADLLAL